MTDLEMMIKSGRFGMVRGLNDDPIALSPSWFDGEGDLSALFADEETEPTLDMLFERSGGGLDLLIRAGESGEDGSTPFVASTADVDRMGDVVEQSWRLARFRANPVILHEHGGGFAGATMHGGGVVGRGVAKLNRDADRLEIRVHWDDSEVNPLGRLMAHQHRNGFRRAGSVGFLPGKSVNRLDLPDDDPRKAPKGTARWRAGHLFRFNELLEFSTVATPANAAALQLSLRAQEEAGPTDQIRQLVTDSVDRKTAEALIPALLDALQKDAAIRRTVQALVWATPEPEGDLSALFSRGA